MDKHTLLFQNLKWIKDYWAREATDSLKPTSDLIWSEYADSYKLLQQKLITREDQEAFQRIQNEIIKGVVHSFLVMIDGGDQLADDMRIDLIDVETKQSLKEHGALYEGFYAYLFDVEGINNRFDHRRKNDN
ncbi:histidine kinase [Paenibacillus sp. GSMTC-2017]|uniref:histidine kinase n=1 Tax=Paenibacillus sp. GSMTC-2017 TaxID=2794350 RepID=UPI0018D9AB6B|nr:histidine kinase [Paenibacillus sp. GSMTC-2017]MBH5317315.1 histidine kinase [Paenibacillus sp. GSMTC-2017]